MHTFTRNVQPTFKNLLLCRRPVLCGDSVLDAALELLHQLGLRFGLSEGCVGVCAHAHTHGCFMQYSRFRVVFRCLRRSVDRQERTRFIVVTKASISLLYFSLARLSYSRMLHVRVYDGGNNFTHSLTHHVEVVVNDDWVWV